MRCWYDLRSRLNHWIWNLAANALNTLPCWWLWQPGWVEIVKIILFLNFVFYQWFVTGVVNSPNYPSFYPSNLEKTDTIHVKLGQILLLRFTAFDIEAHFDNDNNLFCFHYLTIMDGDGTTLMEENCGHSMPADITSRSNIVKLHFSSSSSFYTKPGWSVTWTAVTPGLKALIKLGHHPVLILPIPFQVFPPPPPAPPHLDLTQIQNVISLLVFRESLIMVAPLQPWLQNIIHNGGVWPSLRGAIVRLHALNTVWEFPAQFLKSLSLIHQLSYWLTAIRVNIIDSSPCWEYKQWGWVVDGRWNCQKA